MTVLDPQRLDRILWSQDPFGSGHGRVDLRGTHFVTAGAMVQLVAVCHALAASGRHAVVSFDDRRVLLYLMRAGLRPALDCIADFEPPLPAALARAHERKGGLSPLLIQITRLREGLDLDGLPARVAGVLRDRLAYPPVASWDIATAVAEAATNTFDHSGMSFGFLAMQVYGGGRFLEIGVSDHGIGIAASLERNPRHGRLASDADAIEFAVLEGISEFDEPERGRGLHRLLELVASHGGKVRIRSGRAALRYSGSRRVALAQVGPLAGVHVALTLPAKPDA